MNKKLKSEEPKGEKSEFDGVINIIIIWYFRCNVDMKRKRIMKRHSNLSKIKIT